MSLKMSLPGAATWCDLAVLRAGALPSANRPAVMPEPLAIESDC